MRPQTKAFTTVMLKIKSSTRSKDKQWFVGNTISGIKQNVYENDEKLGSNKQN